MRPDTAVGSHVLNPEFSYQSEYRLENGPRTVVNMVHTGGNKFVVAFQTSEQHLCDAHVIASPALTGQPGVPLNRGTIFPSVCV